MFNRYGDGITIGPRKDDFLCFRFDPRQSQDGLDGNPSPYSRIVEIALADNRRLDFDFGKAAQIIITQRNWMFHQPRDFQPVRIQVNHLRLASDMQASAGIKFCQAGCNRHRSRNDHRRQSTRSSREGRSESGSLTAGQQEQSHHRNHRKAHHCVQHNAFQASVQSPKSAEFRHQARRLAGHRLRMNDQWYCVLRTILLSYNS